MTFLIDKFFIEEFNKEFGTELTYQEFAIFHKAVRAKKRAMGLVKARSGFGGNFGLSEYDIQAIKSFYPEYSKFISDAPGR